MTSNVCGVPQMLTFGTRLAAYRDMKMSMYSLITVCAVALTATTVRTLT